MIIGDISNNELGVVFNGVHSRDFGLRLDSISDPLPTLTDVTQDIQPIIGDLYQGTDVQSKTINVTFRMVGSKSYQQKYTRLHEIMAWLMPIDGEEYELTLDILPNRSFYAHVSASFDFTDSLYDATFTVPFTCSDPRAYGPLRQYQIGARNLAIGTGNVFTSSSTVGQVAKLYTLDADAALWTGQMSLTFDWSAGNTCSFKVRKAVVTDSGVITYTDLTTVSSAAKSGTQTVTVNWSAINASDSVYLAFQSVSGAVQVQIYNLQIAKTSAKGFGSVINADTNEVDNRLISVNTDSTVTLHDEESTAESFPVFILQPKQELTRIAITAQDSDDYLYMGSEIDPDSSDQIVNNEPLVLHDYCQTLNTWHPFSNPSNTDGDNKAFLPPFDLENGVIGIDSAMKSNTESIGVATNRVGGAYKFASKFTKGKWNGPGAIHNAFPGAYSDWQIDLRMQMNVLDPRAQGKMEFYLLDQNNRRMGKIMFKENVANGEAVVLDVEIGTHSDRVGIYNSVGSTTKAKTSKVALKVYKNGTKEKSTVKVKGKKVVKYSTNYLPVSTQKGTFTNWFGTVTFRKVGKTYSVVIMRQNSSTLKNSWASPIKASWTDTKGKYADFKLANCAVYLAKWPVAEDLANPVKGYKNDQMYVTDVKVHNIIDGGNTKLSTPTPIAEPGDEIHIDTSDGTVTKNGHLFNSSNNHLIKAPGSNIIGLALRGSADKTLSFYPIDGWSIAHQSVFY